MSEIYLHHSPYGVPVLDLDDTPPLTAEAPREVDVPLWVSAAVLAVLLILAGTAGYFVRAWTASPPVQVTAASQTSQDAATVYADPGACTPDYYRGAWHICGATYPAATEDEFAVWYGYGAWHIVYCDPTVDAYGQPVPCEGR